MLTQHLGCRRTAIFRFWDTWRCDFCPCSCWSCLSYFLDPPSTTFLNKHRRICKAMQNGIGDTSPKQRWMYDRYQKVKLCTDIYQDVSVGLDIFFLLSLCLRFIFMLSRSYSSHLQARLLFYPSLYTCPPLKSTHKIIGQKHCRNIQKVQVWMLWCVYRYTQIAFYLGIAESFMVFPMP